MGSIEFIGIVGVVLAAFVAGRLVERRKRYSEEGAGEESGVTLVPVEDRKFREVPATRRREPEHAQAVQAKRSRSRVTPDPTLRQTLLIMCLHDEAKVDRLIELERETSPDADINELMRAAIERCSATIVDYM